MGDVISRPRDPITGRWVTRRAEDRFWSYVDRRGPDDCWKWTGAKDPRGYGRVRWNDGTRFAHRIAYSLLRGDPGDLDLDHLCRNPPCANPDHLEPVAHLVNVQRGASSAVLTAKYAAHLHCPQGHPLIGDNLYAYVRRYGYVNKQCKQCRRERARKKAT